jgi:transposase-like protein
MLTKVTVEAALNAELEHHLGYQKNEKALTSNSRNGYSSKKSKRKKVALS